MAVTSKLVLIAVLLAASQAQGATCANTVTSGFEWDYPAADLPRIDGFKFYVNGTVKATLDAATQTVLCKDLGLTSGTIYSAEVSAYNAMGEKIGRAHV